MRIPWTRLALLAAGCLSAASARADNTILGNLALGNTTTRFILLQTEDHTCNNTTQLTPGPLAAGPGINNCTIYANDPLATYTDLSNDYFGQLSFLGTSTLLPGDTNVYQIVVDSVTWGKSLAPTLKAANATLGTNTSITVLFDETSGNLASPSPSWSASAVFTLGTSTIPLTLTGLPDPADTAYFAAPNATTGAAYPPALYDGQPLEMSCAFELAQYPGGPGTVGSPGTSLGPGLPAPWPGLCPATTAGLAVPPGFAGTAMTGFGMTTIALSGGAPLADAVWTALKWKIQEITQNDTDSDGFIDPPTGYFNGPNKDGNTNSGGAEGYPVSGYFDNCPYAANATQSDKGGVGTGSAPDGIGDACQCGDVNNDGVVNSTDSVVFGRALVGLSPYFTVAGMPGNAKCDSNGDGVCNSADKSIIGRALVGLSPGIKQVCHPAKTFP